MKLPLRALPGAVALLALAASTLWAQKPAAGLFDQALRATQAGRLADAESLYRQLLKAEPGNAGAWANLGLILAQSRRLPEAIAALRKASTLSPGTLDILAQIAALEWRAGQTDAALADARKVRARDPKNATALSVEAGVLTQRKAYAEALAPLRALDRVQGGRDRATLQSLTFTLAVTGRRTEALAAARRLCALVPKDPSAHLMHGDLAGQAGFDTKDAKLLAEARVAYKSAYALAPKDLRAGLNAAFAADMAGDQGEARRILAAVVQANPDSAAAHYALGRLQLTDAQTPEAERMEKARRSFEAAVSLAPRDPDNATALGAVLLAQPKPEYDRAANCFRAALQVAPENERARRGLVDALWKGGRRADAVVVQRDLAARRPSDPEVVRRLATLLRTEGRRAESYAVLRELAARRAKDPAPLVDLAAWLVEDNQPAEAVTALESALARAPGDAVLVVRLGDALDKAGRPDDALARYETALTANPRNEAAHAARVALLERRQRPADALAARERWVKAVPGSNPARWGLAQACADAGRDDEALALMAALTLRRDDPMRLTYRLGPAELLEKRGRRDEAIAALRRLFAEEPTEPIRLRLAQALAVRGDIDAARQTLKPLLDGTTPAVAHLTLATIYERAGRPDDAAREFEDTIQLDPQQSAALDGLWRVRTAQGKPDAAAAFVAHTALSERDVPNGALVAALEKRLPPARYREFTAQALEKYPKSAVAHTLRADALVKETPDEAARTEAARLYGQAAALALSDPDPPLQQGLQLEALGRKADAIAAYTESAARRRGGSADFALKRLGAPVPPERKKAP